MEPTEHIWMDGKLVPWDEATVHVLVHGLHYGTGAFEGIRAYETESGTAVFRLTEHIERLQRSCKALMVPVDWKVADLVAASKELLSLNELTSGYIRPIVFYGTGSMGIWARWSWMRRWRSCGRRLRTGPSDTVGNPELRKYADRWRTASLFCPSST